MGLGLLIVIGTIAALFVFGIRIITEYERGVIFRLGRYIGVKTAGFKWIIPGVDLLGRDVHDDFSQAP